MGGRVFDQGRAAVIAAARAQLGGRIARQTESPVPGAGVP